MVTLTKFPLEPVSPTGAILVLSRLGGRGGGMIPTLWICEWRNDQMNRSIATMIVAGALLGGGGALAAEKTVTLAVENMTCELCPGIVKKSLTKVDGVGGVTVSLEKKTATVTYDDKKTTLAA